MLPAFLRPHRGILSLSSVSLIPACHHHEYIFTRFSMQQIASGSFLVSFSFSLSIFPLQYILFVEPSKVKCNFIYYYVSSRSFGIIFSFLHQLLHYSNTRFAYVFFLHFFENHKFLRSLEPNWVSDACTYFH